MSQRNNMKKIIITYVKQVLRFLATFLFGFFFVRALYNHNFDIFYFRENSYVVYAILYLSGIVVCCCMRK